MKPAPSLFVVGLLVAHLGAAGPAHAQATSAESPTSEGQQAHEHFSLGVKLYADGDFGPALAQFQRAYALKPHFRVLYNIAQCQFELRDYVAARAALRRYLAEGGSTALDAERRTRVEADLADMGRRIAEVDIQSNVRGAVVYIDGRKIGTTPLSQPIEVSEGQRSVSVESSAGGTKQRSLLLVGGERQTITVNFELIAPEASTSYGLEKSPARPPLPSSEPSLGTGFWVAGVGAALLAGGAGVTGYLALRAQDERRAHLDRPGVSAELDSDSRRIRTLAITSDAFLGGAIICAGIATTILVVHGRETRPALAVGPGNVALLGSF
jgi:hypothetical protein